MRRHLLIALACLLAGVVTSVGVACGFALRGDPTFSLFRIPWSRNSVTVAWLKPGAFDEVIICDRTRRSAGLVRVVFLATTGQINEVTIAPHDRILANQDETHVISRVAGPPPACHPPPEPVDRRSEFQFGWPASCMWGAQDMLR